jgi:hypothetical protein
MNLSAKSGSVDTLYPWRTMPKDKEPTQRTQPKKGEPLTIPVPTRGEIDDAIAKVSQPVSPKPKRKNRKAKPR